MFTRRKISKRKQALLDAYKRLIERRKKRRETRSIKLREEEIKVKEFREWCINIGIELHPKLYIGRDGSRHEIGVVAIDTIPRGELIAKIPRSSVLTASQSVISEFMKLDQEFMSHVGHMTSWVPLLIALTVEYAQKGKSGWQPYLNLVPNNSKCPPAILWSECDRKRLLEGTGVDTLVERDLKRVHEDYETIVLPFFKRHISVIPKLFHSLQLYEQSVSFVMSYSFTDSEGDDPLSRTMMIPFVDLLNHHTHHNAELSFHSNCLKLVATRNIQKGEEILNTFGELPNYSLLHTYGFVINNNPLDAACITTSCLQMVYFSSNDHNIKWMKERWKLLEDMDMMEDVYEVNINGEPDEDLLDIIKLLLIKDSKLSELLNDEYETSRNIEDLSLSERKLLISLIKQCIEVLPESLSTCQQVLEHKFQDLNPREQSSLILCTGQHNCLNILLNTLGEL